MRNLKALWRGIFVAGLAVWLAAAGATAAWAANPSINAMTPAAGHAAGATVDSASFTVPGSLANSKLVAILLTKGTSTAIPYGTALHTRAAGANVQDFTSSSALQAGLLEGSAGVGLQVWYLDNPTPGTYTAHLSTTTEETGTPNRTAIEVFLLQDVPAGAPTYFQAVTSPTDGIAGQASISNSLTTTKNNALIFGNWALGATGSTITFPSSPWSTLISGGVDSTGSSGVQLATTSQSVATAGAVNPSFISSLLFSRETNLVFGWDPIAPDTVTVTDPVRGTFYNTDTPLTGTFATVPFSGTYAFTSGAVTTGGSIEVELLNKVDGSVFQTWTALTSPTFSNATVGTASGTMHVPVGGGYSNTYGIYRQMRIKASGGGVIATSANGANSFAVGDAIIVGAVSSSGERPFFADVSGVTPDGRISTYVDPSATGGGGGPGWGQVPFGAMIYPLGNALIAENGGRPLSFIDNGKAGSTLLTDWVNADLSAGAVYTTQVGFLANSGITKAIALIAGVGGNDIDSFVSITGGEAGATARTSTVIGRYRTLLGQPTLPVLWLGIQHGGLGTTISTNEVQVRHAELAWVRSDAYALYLQRTGYYLQSDETHLGTAEQDLVGKIGAHWLSGVLYATPQEYAGPGYSGGPTFSPYNVTTGKIRATFTLRAGATGIVNARNDSTFVLEPTCFVVDIGGTPQTVISATIVSTNEVDVQLATGLGGPMHIEYGMADPGNVAFGTRPNCVWDQGPAP